MALVRLQVSTYRSDDPEIRNRIVNTFYLDVGFDPLAFPNSPDWATLVNDTAEVFGEYRPLPGGWNRVNVKGYAMGDAEPRPPRHETTWTVQRASSGVTGVREVALCLSFYADQNRPRRRGRLFIGPWSSQSMSERPPAGDMAHLQELAAQISALGGVNVDWQVWSPTDNQARKATHWWVDNEWDTIRSRGLVGLTRISGTTGE